MLKILATIYLEQGKAEKTIYIYRELMQHRAQGPGVCQWQYNIVHAMITAGDNKQKVKEIENLVKLYAQVQEHQGVLKGAALAGVPRQRRGDDRRAGRRVALGGR